MRLRKNCAALSAEDVSLEDAFTLDEFTIAFVLIFVASFLIYMLGRWMSPKSIQSENGQSTYACGEKTVFTRLKINISLYKYLIYFVILDSSVLLVAFASFATQAMNIILFMVYLSIILASTLLLLEGGN